MRALRKTLRKAKTFLHGNASHCTKSKRAVLKRAARFSSVRFLETAGQANHSSAASFSAFFTAAAISPLKSGCGRFGRLLNSG